MTKPSACAGRRTVVLLTCDELHVLAYYHSAYPAAGVAALKQLGLLEEDPEDVREYRRTRAGDALLAAYRQAGHV